jgi:hypothetical protein
MTKESALLALAIVAACNHVSGRDERTERTRSALTGLDLGAEGYTPWAAMHMLLVVGESGSVLLNGKPRGILDILCTDDLHPGQLLVRSAQGLVVQAKVPLFAHEMEDHHAQFWALRAQSLHDRRQVASQDQWVQCAQALLDLEKTRNNGEREWLIILGGLSALNLPDCELRKRVVSTTLGQLAGYLRGEGVSRADVSACGGMHGAAAVQICTRMEDLDGVLRDQAEELLDVLADHVQRFRREDGYVEFPGLHYPFKEPTAVDSIRVLGHIVEWWSYDPLAKHQDERVVQALERAVGMLHARVSVGRLHSKEVGELAHALSALARLGR